MNTRNFYLINALTAYRLVMAPVLISLVFAGRADLFKWLLPLSFFTDLIDGFLARRFRVASVFGSRLDSIADDLTMLAGITGAFVFKKEFVWDHIAIVAAVVTLLVFQNSLALVRYRRISSFHTYLAKAAAGLQGSFLILLFLLPEPVYLLFYAAALVSVLDLLEEIILVLVIKKWKTDVKGLYWVLKKKKNGKGTGFPREPEPRAGALKQPGLWHENL
jgi:phosphatidylglycerophosphate synthase